MTNQITVVGHLGGDPETRTTTWGDLETTFRLATNERFRDKDGNWKDGPTTWLTVKTMRRLAQHVRDHVGKGDRVIVVGKLRVRTWQNENGSGKSAEIDADSVGRDVFSLASRGAPAASTAAVGVGGSPGFSGSAGSSGSAEPAEAGQAAHDSGADASPGWATPGGSAPGAEGELVGTAAARPAGYSDDPPF